MTIQTSTLRPGLLVSLKSSVSGNVSYQRRDIVSQHLTKEGKSEAKWETERTIVDPVEHDAAWKVRNKARSLIASVCSQSAFGLLCPETAEDELDAAVKEARTLVEAFNSEAKLTRVGIYVMTGRIAADDVEAVRAINSEVRDLLSEMERGLKNLDVKAVRDAASKAKNIGAMLSPDATARIQVAIDAARTSARKIVQSGEQISMEIDTRAIKAITEQRTAFLDLDVQKQKIAAPKSAGRAIDMQSSPVKIKASKQSRKIEVE